jgi:hypothetical protein
MLIGHEHPWAAWRAAMAGHDMRGPKGRHRLEHRDPAVGITRRAVAENAVDIHDIAGEHHVALVQPDKAVARRMGRAAMHDLEAEAAQIKRVTGLERDVSIGALAAGKDPLEYTCPIWRSWR